MNKRRCLNFLISVVVTAAFPFALAIPSFSAEIIQLDSLLELPGVGEENITALSKDGKTVIGMSTSDGLQGVGFRWSQEAGILPLPDFDDLGMHYPLTNVLAVSSDGSCIGGTISNDIIKDAAYWNEKDGTQVLMSPSGPSDLTAVSESCFALIGNDPDHVVSFSRSGSSEILFGPTIIPEWQSANAVAVGRYGKIIAGNGTLNPFGSQRAFVLYTDSQEYQVIGEEFNTEKVFAKDISSDGTTVVGNINDDWDNSLAFIWTETTGIMQLESLPIAPPIIATTANAISADGSVVVGESDGGAFIWSQEQGVQNLKNTLESEFGLDLNGWILENAIDISADGTVIVGYGMNPQYEQVNWLINLKGPDSDNDGLSDDEELALYLDPLNPDTDGDSLPDGWENEYFTDPNHPNGTEDFDNDGLTNAQEYALWGQIHTMQTQIKMALMTVKIRSPLIWIVMEI